MDLHREDLRTIGRWWSVKPTLQHPTVLRRLALPTLSGPGRAYAPLVWLYLVSRLRWRASHRRVWPSNTKIATATGLPLRAVEAGLACLRSAGKIETTYGRRPGRFRPGRTITIRLLGDGPNPVIAWPQPEQIDGIWGAVRGVRDRPASLAALGVALAVVAAAEHGGDVGGLGSVHMRLAIIRGLVGARHGSTFNNRLEALAEAGVISRLGDRWCDGIGLHVPAPAPLPNEIDAKPRPSVLEAATRMARASVATVRARWEAENGAAARAGPYDAGRPITLEELDEIHRSVDRHLRLVSPVEQPRKWHGGIQAEQGPY